MPLRFAEGLTLIDAGGAWRKLAALKPGIEFTGPAKKYSAKFTTVNPSEWQETDLSSFGSPIRDQGEYGSCTGHAGVTALDIVRRQQNLNDVLLSCTFPYGLVNGGHDNGASVSSILTVLENVGTCTFAEVNTDMIYQRQFPPSAWDTAKKYKAVQAFLCRSFEEICDAINRGFPVAFGIQIGQNFSRPDANGVCPPPDRVVGGHALCGVGLKKSGVGTWLIKFQNSWTKKWGLNGYAYLSKGSFTNMVDAYALCYVLNDNPPPVVPKLEEKSVTRVKIIPPLEIKNDELPRGCSTNRKKAEAEGMLKDWEWWNEASRPKDMDQKIVEAWREAHPDEGFLSKDEILKWWEEQPKEPKLKITAGDVAAKPVDEVPPAPTEEPKVDPIPDPDPDPEPDPAPETKKTKKAKKAPKE